MANKSARPALGPTVRVRVTHTSVAWTNDGEYAGKTPPILGIAQALQRPAEGAPTTKCTLGCPGCRQKIHTEVLSVVATQKTRTRYRDKKVATAIAMVLLALLGLVTMGITVIGTLILIPFLLHFNRQSREFYGVLRYYPSDEERAAAIHGSNEHGYKIVS